MFPIGTSLARGIVPTCARPRACGGREMREDLQGLFSAEEGAMGNPAPGPVWWTLKHPLVVCFLEFTSSSSFQ